MAAEKIAALKQTSLFRELSDKELSHLAKHAVTIHLKKGDMLFLAGEQARGLFVIVSGKVRAFQHNAEGREHVMHVDTAGAVMAEVPVFDDGPYPASAVAEEKTTALFIGKQEMCQFCMEHPAFMFKALKLMAARVRKHAQMVELLTFHEVGQRLALLLLAHAKIEDSSLPRKAEFLLPLSNHQIATRIGSVRDVVSRAFTRLQHDGLITLDGRNVTIPDVAALKRYCA
ncbi:MAG TPA: Crp/Fnr family transcriptional regulator [Edaphobacter sp.]|nr:Crp/Fnr family transcriptional regulator [Edaphobacter sp.]